MLKDRATAELLHSAVHDLKGPASRLRVLVDLLRRSAPQWDDDAKVLLQHIRDSAQSLELTVDGLRSYAEVTGRDLQLELMDLAASVMGAMANLSREMEACGAQIAHAGLPVIQADRALVTWLIGELLANAIRFRGSAAPRIEIAAHRDGAERWVISVLDNGPGIEASLAERAFRPFKKLTRQGGAGMGLAICRNIIERHGGEIWAQPNSMGAEIRFSIPDGPLLAGQPR